METLRSVGIPSRCLVLVMSHNIRHSHLLSLDTCGTFSTIGGGTFGTDFRTCSADSFGTFNYKMKLSLVYFKLNKLH
jgi:hypothetical protein